MNTVTARRVGMLAGMASVFALVAGCTASPAPSDPSAEPDSPAPSDQSAEPEEGVFSLEEVQAGASPNQVGSQCFQVPKNLEEDITLAFINPGQTVPFFQAWSVGYNQAAEFYGVGIHEVDIDFVWEDALSAYEQLSVFQPQVVGTLVPDGSALLARATEDDVAVVPVDIPIEGNDFFVGVPNAQSGKLGGTALVEAVQDELDGWSDRNIIILGLQQDTTEVTVERVTGGLDAASAAIPGATVDTLDMGTLASTDDGLTGMTDYLTAHPDDVILVIAMNDDTSLGALQAVRAANRTDDVRIMTLGGDSLARQALAAAADEVFVGAVDYNPIAEGWCWVESSIAVVLGEESDPYEVTQVLTPENVGDLYPND